MNNFHYNQDPLYDAIEKILTDKANDSSVPEEKITESYSSNAKVNAAIELIDGLNAADFHTFLKDFSDYANETSGWMSAVNGKTNKPTWVTLAKMLRDAAKTWENRQIK
jgi:hypothetical protein